MNNWSAEQYQMQNMMGMPMNQMMQQSMMPPLLPPPCIVNDQTSTTNPVQTVTAGSFIGPIQPDNAESTAEIQDSESKHQGSKNREKREDSRDSRDRRDRDKDRSRQRRSRERHDRNDYNDDRRSDRRNDRDRADRNRRDKRTKWDTDNTGLLVQGMPEGMSMGNMMMQGGMVPYNNMNMMGQQPIEMNMQNMSNMPHMTNMTHMNSVSNMMPGMNMMQNMMDPMMINQQMMMLASNQPIYVTDAVLLPPVPGAAMPNRRERPPGCKTIFIGGLPDGVQPNVVQQIFQRFGDIIDVKLHRQGVCHVRFQKQESVEQAFFMSGFRFKAHDQTENEATTLFVDYALNRDDQTEYEKNKRSRETTPPRIEPFSTTALNAIAEKIKSDEHFGEAAPTLAVWLERGECNKKNASTFYSLVQATNNQIRRLFNEKMSLDDEYQSLKASMRDKFANVVMQFEQVAKILTAAKHQRVSDHFSKQQRRNIEMWLKMTEEVDNIKEEFTAIFEDDEVEKTGKNVVPAEKYEQLKAENESLTYELEGYKNEAYLAKDEAERKFEKFKAHFIAQQALQNKQIYPPLPPPPNATADTTMAPPDDKTISSTAVSPSEAKLISILTAFLLVHPLGASLDYLMSYVRSMMGGVTQAAVHQVLQKYTDVFSRKSSGFGASMEHRWAVVTFDNIKNTAC